MGNSTWVLTNIEGNLMRLIVDAYYASELGIVCCACSGAFVESGQKKGTMAWSWQNIILFRFTQWAHGFGIWF
jgi:hypothetical protein